MLLSARPLSANRRCGALSWPDQPSGPRESFPLREGFPSCRAGSEGGASRFRDFDAHDLDRRASDAAIDRGRETVADQARDYLPREAVREQARFGASIGRVGEQAERALASDLWHLILSTTPTIARLRVSVLDTLPDRRSPPRRKVMPSSAMAAPVGIKEPQRRS